MIWLLRSHHFERLPGEIIAKSPQTVQIDPPSPLPLESYPDTLLVVGCAAGRCTVHVRASSWCHLSASMPWACKVMNGAMTPAMSCETPMCLTKDWNLSAPFLGPFQRCTGCLCEPVAGSAVGKHS